jgi:glycosyltransferase involved in cell wall biosynthesis
MNIAVDLRLNGPWGIGTFIRGFENHVPKLIPEHHYFFLITKDQAPNQNLKNVTYVRFQVPCFHLLEQYYLSKFLFSSQIEAFHAMYINIPLFMPSKTKLVTNIYDLAFDYDRNEGKSSFKYGLYKFFIHRILTKSKAVIVQSEFTNKDLINRYSYKKATVISPGFDGNYWKTLEESNPFKEQPERYILFIGNNRPRKNIPLLLVHPGFAWVPPTECTQQVPI